MGNEKSLVFLVLFACAFIAFSVSTMVLVESQPATDTGNNSGDTDTDDTSNAPTTSKDIRSGDIDTIDIDITLNDTGEPYPNLTGAVLNDSTGYDENRSVYNVSPTDKIALNSIAYMQNYSLLKSEWPNYRNYTAFRAALGQNYEAPAVNVTAIPSLVTVRIQAIGANSAVRITINKTREMSVMALDIAVKNNVSDVDVRIEKLPERPPAIKAEPPPKVYQYLQIVKQRITNEDISDVGIKFKVEKSWLAEQNITNHSLVALYRLEHDNWTELPTKKVSEDDENVHYEAFSPGLSYFVIGITAKMTSPIEFGIPTDRDRELGGEPGTEDNPEEIFFIRFSWVFVVVIIAIVILLKYQPFAGRIEGFLSRESEEDLQNKLSGLKGEEEEALKRYYKRVIGERELNEIVDDIKKREFGVEMRIKKLQEKKKPAEQ